MVTNLLENISSLTIALAFSLDHQLLVASIGINLALWNLSNFEFEEQFNHHSGWVNSLVFNPDNKYLVSGGDDVSIRLWDIKHLKVTK